VRIRTVRCRRSGGIAPRTTPKRSGTGRWSGPAKLDGDHVDDVVLVVSELTTNAIKYGGASSRNIYLEIVVWSKWTLIAVADRTHEVSEVASANDEDGDLRESGRGLDIVEILAERWWWHPREFSKTANAAGGVGGGSPHRGWGSSPHEQLWGLPEVRAGTIIV
jgi:hypothetical protein